MRSIVLGVVLLSLAAAGGAAMADDQGGKPPAPQAGKAPAPLDLAGAMSGIRQGRQLVVYNRRDFAALWKEHTQGREGAPPPPSVDFRRYSVIAVFMGARPTGGFSVAIGDVRRSAGAALVPIALRKPAPDMLTTQAFTSPFAFRAVPKLPAKVTFDVKETTAR